MCESEVHALLICICIIIRTSDGPGGTGRLVKQISCCVVIEYVCTAPVPPCAYRSRSAVASIFTLPPDRARPSIRYRWPARPAPCPAARLPAARRLPARACPPDEKIRDSDSARSSRIDVTRAPPACRPPARAEQPARLPAPKRFAICRVPGHAPAELAHLIL